eukprot:CAMPEP_0181255480 /NCGR_PEP_ID=MMETSP1096-20121128/49170_1 /TAXON_ID=156174 ORGANISM="Chrysochromulina ericina, Strain CCMP281" /NCGR_SAMPLE_ID=MMETSP1096 /ASSEMBLY_ACC=CAM_ASM_000453 /LENGTH=122 /DNA_ID=CAMNT_0023353607 /DNA_START=137 /DNA_END=506 /DNA_ORIENTATION=+
MCAVGYAAAEDLHEDMRVHVRLGVVGWQEVWRRRALMEPGGRRARKRVCQDVVHSTQLCAVTVGQSAVQVGGGGGGVDMRGRALDFRGEPCPTPYGTPPPRPQSEARRPPLSSPQHHDIRVS